MDSPEINNNINKLDITKALNQGNVCQKNNGLPPTTTLDSSAYPNPNIILIANNCNSNNNNSNNNTLAPTTGTLVQKPAHSDPAMSNNEQGGFPLTRGKHVIAAGTAATVSTLAVQPLDVLRTRLQVLRIPWGELKASSNHPTIIGSLVRISKVEGLQGLYRGIFPSLASVVPSISIYFTLYSELKVYMGVPTGSYTYDTCVQSLCAGTSSFATAVITNPLWVIKTRLQTLTSQTDLHTANSPTNNNASNSLNAKIVKSPHGILSFANSSSKNFTPSVPTLNNNYMGYYYNCLNGKPIFKDGKLIKCCGWSASTPLSSFASMSHFYSINNQTHKSIENSTFVNNPKTTANKPNGFSEMKRGTSKNPNNGFNNTTNNNNNSSGNTSDNNNNTNNTTRRGFGANLRNACSSFFRSTTNAFKRFFSSANTAKSREASHPKVATSSKQTPRNTFHCYREIISKEGMIGLYRGLSASVLTSTQAMVQFPLYETLKRAIYEQTGHLEECTRVWVSYLSGSALAASIACTVSYPSEVVRSRMQIQGFHSSMPKRYNSVFGAFKTIWREEGIRGMYRGLGTSLVRLTPAHAISFTVYEWILRILCDRKGI